MIPILLLAILQAAPAQEKSVESQVESFLKGDAKARESLLKAGAHAIRPLLKERDKGPEKIEALLAELRAAAAHPKDSSTPATLDKKATFRFKGLNHEQAIGFVQAMSGVFIHFDEFDAKDLKSDKVTMEVADISARAALDVICRQTGLDYGFFHNAVVIGKPERLWSAGKSTAAYGPSGAERQARTPADQALFKQIGELKTSMDFQGVSLSDMAAYIREFSGVDISIEGDAGQLTYNWKSSEARLLDTLGLVTQSRGLDFMIQEGRVVIGTRNAIEKLVAPKK